MASVKIFFDTRKTRESGLYPVIIRVDHKGQWFPIKTGISCKIEHWDKGSLKIIKTKQTPNYNRDNSTITGILSEAQKFIADNVRRLNSINCRQLRDEISNQINGHNSRTSLDLNLFVNKIVDDLNKAGRVKYASVFSSVLSSLNNFQPRLQLNDITAPMLNDYQNWCLKTGMSYGGISVYLRALRKVSIDALRNLKLEKDSPIWHHWNYFRFYFNARGMNLIDVAFLRVGSINEGRLVYTRKKSHKPYSIAITKEMKQVLEHYLPGKNKIDLIFPLLADIINCGDPKYIRTTYNDRLGDHIKYLNKMAKMAGINTHITTYTIRHSYASGMRDMGAGIHHIKEALGHDNAATTEIYLSEIGNEELDDINEKFLDG